jgi:hypothetical protein
VTVGKGPWIVNIEELELSTIRDSRRSLPMADNCRRNRREMLEKLFQRHESSARSGSRANAPALDFTNKKQ